MSNIRVLVVDDSAFMRRAIVKMLETGAEIEVVASAASGEEAIEKARELLPDVITMDVEMPGMGGLEAVHRIIAWRPIPIIMVSALTREGAETTLRALELGALDFIPKPDSAYIDIVKVKNDLINKVHAFGRRNALLRRPRPLAGAPPVSTAPRRLAPPEPPRAYVPPVTVRTGHYACVALGTSTGGPVALSSVIPKIPKAFPIPIIIVQHMPPGFTKPLADRLNSASAIEVLEGQSGMPLRPGVAIVAPAGQQFRLRRGLNQIEVRLEADTGASLHVPSVDVMATAVGEMYGAGSLGVIMTGMGNDGVEGLKTIKQRGGYVIGQDEVTSVVYGMPRAAAQAGLVDRVVALGDISRVLCELTGTAFTVA